MNREQIEDIAKSKGWINKGLATERPIDNYLTEKQYKDWLKFVKEAKKMQRKTKGFSGIANVTKAKDMFNTLFNLNSLDRGEFVSIIWSNPVEDDFIGTMSALMDFWFED